MLSFLSETHKSSILLEYKKNFDPSIAFTFRETYTATEVENIYNQFSFFLSKLENLKKYDVVLISIGSGLTGKVNKYAYLTQQQLPDYIIAHAKKNNKTLIINLDFEFSDSKRIDILKKNINLILKEDKDHHNFKSPHKDLDLTLEVFSCDIPKKTSKSPLFYKFLEDNLKAAMNNHTKIYIANHIQAYDLEDIPLIADVYNNIKKTHESSSLLQLYTQAGFSPQVTYYADLLYTEKSLFSYRDESGNPKEKTEKPEFYLHPDISTLEKVPLFQPDHINKKEEKLITKTEKPQETSGIGSEVQASTVLNTRKKLI